MVVAVAACAAGDAKIFRRDHAVVSYSGISQEYAGAIATTAEAARLRDRIAELKAEPATTAADDIDRPPKKTGRRRKPARK